MKKFDENRKTWNEMKNEPYITRNNQQSATNLQATDKYIKNEMNLVYATDRMI